MMRYSSQSAAEATPYMADARAGRNPRRGGIQERAGADGQRQNTCCFARLSAL